MMPFGPELTGISLSVLGWVLSVISCGFLDSVDQDLQTIKAPSVVAIILGVVGLFVNIVKAKCPNCIHDERVKARLIVSSGGVFITAALIQCAPFLWTALVTSEKNKKIGVGLGAVSSILLIIGGLMLCTMCPPYEDKPKSRDETKRYNTYPQTCVIYSATPSSTAQSSHHKNN